MLLSLGAIGASEKYIGEGRWGMAATEILLCLLFLYPTFRGIQKVLRMKKAREIAQCHLDKDCFIVRNSYTADKHFVYLLYFYLITLLT